MRILSRRERRLAALGGLIAAVVLVEALIVAPVAAGFSDRAAQRSELAAQYAHAEQTMAQLPRLRRLARVSTDASRALVMAGATPDAAGLALEDRLRRSVDAIGGDYRGGNHDGTAADRVRARAVADMPIEKLAPWLARVENEQPYVVVERLEIGADAALASQKAETLDVKIEISIPFLRAHA